MMADTTAEPRENYTKVVMQKTLCVPILSGWEKRWRAKDHTYHCKTALVASLVDFLFFVDEIVKQV